jgi:hypothetical protein
MKLCSGILKQALNLANDEHFYVHLHFHFHFLFRFYNSLVLSNAIPFQRTYFRKIPNNTPRFYTPDAATDNAKLPLQTRTNNKKNTLLKIAILIASNASIIDTGTSCCVSNTSLKQPTPIQNTTLKGISGGLAALGRGTIQLRVKQNEKEPIMLIIDNIIHAPDCPVRLLSPQQLHHQSKVK